MQSQKLTLNERIKRMEKLGLIDPIDEKGFVKIPQQIKVKKGVAQKLLQEDREHH